MSEDFMESGIDFYQIISSLPDRDRVTLSTLHREVTALGYTVKISSVGKKSEDWKCEYLVAKPKSVLCSLRITGQRFSIRAKLPHLAEYSDVLENCTEHCRASLLSASKDCGRHGGRCAGPVCFTVGGITYSKCRHYFLFTDIAPEDAEGVIQLLRSEAGYSKI
jgi:hypothetical protein